MANNLNLMKLLTNPKLDLDNFFSSFTAKKI